MDNYGNVTQVNTYDYGNLTHADAHRQLYLPDGSAYTSRYIFNRLTSTPTTTISYDQYSLDQPSGDCHEWDSHGSKRHRPRQSDNGHLA